MKTFRDTLNKFDEFRKICRNNRLGWTFEYDTKNVMNDGDIAVIVITIGKLGTNYKHTGCMQSVALHNIGSIQEKTIEAFEYSIKRINLGGCGE